MQDEESPSVRRYPVAIAVAVYIIAWFLLNLALPNFLESSSRALVSKAKSEIRNLAVSLETYRVDHQVYPPGGCHVGIISDARGLVPDHISAFPLAPDFNRPRLWDEVQSVCRMLCLIMSLGLALLLVVLTRGRNVLRVIVLCVVSALSCLFIRDPSSFVGPVLALFPLGAASLHGVAWVLGLVEAHRVYQEETPASEILLASYLPAVFAVMVVALMAGGFYVGHESGKRPRTSYAYATDGEAGWIMTSTGPDADYDIDLTTPFIDSPEDGGKRLPATGLLLRELEPLEYDPTNGTISSGDIFRIGP